MITHDTSGNVNEIPKENKTRNRCHKPSDIVNEIQK